jgi:hypothetical protein
MGTGGSIPDAGPIDCGASVTNPAVAAGVCDLLLQNCGPNQTCEPTVVNGTDTTICVPATGLKSASESCYAADECAAGLLCIGLTANVAGTCVGFCCPDGRNLPCNGGACNQQVGFGAISANMCSYGVHCDLLAQSQCPAGEGCHVEIAAGQDVSVCIENSSTPVPLLGTCTYINDCADQQQCFHPGGQGSGTCLWYCALSGTSTKLPPGLGGCPSGQTCQSTYMGGSLDIGGFANIGLCFPNGGL